MPTNWQRYERTTARVSTDHRAPHPLPLVCATLLPRPPLSSPLPSCGVAGQSQGFKSRSEYEESAQLGIPNKQTYDANKQTRDAWKKHGKDQTFTDFQVHVTLANTQFGGKFSTSPSFVSVPLPPPPSPLPFHSPFRVFLLVAVVVLIDSGG
jgi:hypothetical protein